MLKAQSKIGTKPKTKFIFILGTTEIGGAEKQAILLGNELVKRDSFKVVFFLFGTRKGKAALQLEKLGISYKILKIPESHFYFLRLYRILIYILRLRLCRPTILLPYTNNPNIYTSLIWKFTGAKTCIWNQRDEGIGLIYSGLTLKALCNVPCFIANSNGSRDFLIKKFSIPEDKIVVINNGIENKATTLDRQNWRKQYSFRNEDYIICMVANLHKDKDHETLIRAFNNIIYKKSDQVTCDIKNFKLLLAGRYDDKYEYLYKLSEDLNLSDKIFFLNEVDSVHDLLNAVDVSVLSTFSEGLSNVAIESMLAGVPFTGTNIDGILEVLGYNYKDYLANPRDDEDLASKILFFKNNPRLTDEIVRQNKKRVLSHFSLDKLYSNSLTLFLRYIQN